MTFVLILQFLIIIFVTILINWLLSFKEYFPLLSNSFITFLFFFLLFLSLVITFLQSNSQVLRSYYDLLELQWYQFQLLCKFWRTRDFS